MTKFTRIWPHLGMALAAFGMAAGPLAAQVETIDPDSAIDGDLVEQPGDQPVYGEPKTAPSYAPPPSTDGTDETVWDYETQTDPVQTGSGQPQWSEQAAEEAAGDAVDGAVADDPTTTYREDDLIGAAEGVFGKGAEGVAKMIRGLLDDTDLPMFGICLGHQMLALALGGKTIKMNHGHHGANHPVKDVETGKVEITSMNHGFAVDSQTLPQGVIETHVSLFDGSNCGIRLDGRPVFSVQYHPEASPGPHDAAYLFGRFREMVDRHVAGEQITGAAISRAPSN